MKKFGQQFGGKVTKELKERYERSTNWSEGTFVNIEKTGVEFTMHELPKLLYKQFFDKKHRQPAKSIPVKAFEAASFTSDEPQFIWYGHSVVLMRLSGLNVLIDPMLGDNASPIAPFATKRFSEDTIDIIDQLPEIDIVLISHDHYDHLDMDSILRLKGKVKTWWVALGAARHLLSWDIPSNAIVEFDWWDEHPFHDLQITYTPTRHSSGRGVRDQAKCLWGGWSIKSQQNHVWFSGDGGYGNHFKEVAERIGAPDLAFMECGQYNKNWHQIHMYPEESVQAAIEVGVKHAVAVHWAGFALAQHDWKDPIDRFTAEADKLGLKYSTPEIGELFTLNDNPNKRWWDDLD
ncbi:MAG: MBL fold metallo-hydrolase [Flavobacteriales bacterium]|nr:MBL fold metallo-hydrolase [Flavobacteriales bacterium]